MVLFPTNHTVCAASDDVHAAHVAFYAVARSTDVTVMTCMLTIAAAVGVAGNLVVIVVCARHPSAQATQLFILGMAATDIVVCSVVIPYRLVTYHALVSEAACKLFEGLTYCSVMYSLFLLIAVAFERYFAVCRPLSFVLTAHKAKRVIGGLGAVSTAFAVTAGLIAGHYVTVVSPPHNATTVCFTGICNEDGEDVRVMSPRAIFFYSGTLGMVYFLLVPTVVVLYTNVFVVLHKRYDQRVKKLAAAAAVTCSVAGGGGGGGRGDTSVAGAAAVEQTDMDTAAVDNGTGAVHNGTAGGGGRSSLAPPPARQLSVTGPPSAFNQVGPVAGAADGDGDAGAARRVKMSRKDISHKRAAKILLLVTVAFIVTWIPFLSMKLRLVDNVVTIRLTFFLSSVVNPLIYSFTNQQFRDHVKKLFVRGDKT